MAIETQSDTLVNIDTLTGGDRGGRGVFDTLMRSVKSHLVEEFNAHRITKEEYANAYVQLVQGVLTNASQYALQYKVSNQNIKLMVQQAVDIKKGIELKDEQIVQMQKANEMTDAQIITEGLRQSALSAETLNTAKQGVILDNQAADILKDIEQKDANIGLIESNQAATDQNTANAVYQGQVLLKQIDKTEAESAILAQRLISEKAQTQDTIDGSEVTGILGRQRTLYENQAEGYIRDAEQKAAKMFMDMMVTRVSVDEDTYDLTTAGLANEEVASVLNKLRAGAGMS